jgi:hypothetical protein
MLAAPYITAKSLTLVQGAPGSGKTWFVICLAIRAAISNRRTLLVLEEGSRHAIAERLARTVSEPSAFDRMLFVAHHRGFRLDDAQAVERLAQELVEGGFDLVVLDPFSDLHAIEENDQRAMAAVRENLKRLRSAAAVLLALHTRKEAWRAGGGSLADARGSGVLPASADLVLDMAAQTTEPGKTESIIQVAKARDLVDAPRRASFAVVRRGERLELRLTPISAESLSPAQSLEASVLQAIPAPGAVEGVRKSAICEQVKRKKQDVLREVDRLAAAGVLREQGGLYWLAKPPPGSRPTGTAGTTGADGGELPGADRVPATPGTTGTLDTGSPSSEPDPWQGTGAVPGSPSRREEPGTDRRVGTNGVHPDAEKWR